MADGKLQRRTWGVAAGERVIGLVARFDPMKGHRLFLAAAARLAAVHGGIRFVCVGEGPKLYSDQLKSEACRLGLENRVLWAGATDEMAPVYNALDIATSTSLFGEGFSNAIGEAMACAVPCVVTDVGDSAWLVDDPRCIVPVNDAEALCASWLALLSEPTRSAETGRAARRRIERHFSVANLAERTEKVLARR